MPKVNLLLIGAQKSGTTSLYKYMLQHPALAFSSVKEITYFIDTDLHALGDDYYHSFFPDTTGATVVASAHVHMLACREAPARVLDYNADMKFIVVLRNPVTRAWSAYNYALQNAWESKDIDFMEALSLEENRLSSDDHRQKYDLAYFYNGLYWQHLTNWLRWFPQEQFLIVESSGLRQAPDATLKRVWNFLGVDDAVDVDTSLQFNRAGRARWRWVNKIIFNKKSRLKDTLRSLVPGRIRIWIRSRVIPLVSRMNTVEVQSTELPTEVRAAIEPYFRDDLEKLERDFSIKFN